MNSEVPQKRFLTTLWANFLFGTIMVSVIGIGAARAQSTATLRGTVTDPSGAVVPNVKITVRNQGTGVERETQTDASGIFTVPALEPGVYEISTQAKGFRTHVVKDISVSVGSIVVQNIEMSVGEVSQKVTVTGSPQAVQTSTVGVGEVTTQSTVQNLPLNGRHMIDLTSILPGTVVPPTNGFLTFAIRGQGSLAFNTAGNREDTSNFMINGINLNDMVQNQITYQPSIDTVSEFNATNSTFSAEYGRNSGAIVNIATRSGANDFHGEAFDYLRNEDLDAEDFFTNYHHAGAPLPNPPFKRNQFGGNIGGPIQKDRTFFFATYEADRQVQASIFNTAVPTKAQRAAVTNSTVQNLLKYVPNANDTTGTFFQGSASSPVHIDQWTGDVMHRISDKDSVHGYYSFQKDVRVEPTIQGDNLPGWGDLRPAHRQLFTLNETHIFGPAAVNEFRVGFNRVHITFTPATPLNPSTLGINDGINSSVGIPQIVVSGSLDIGGPSGFPQGRGDTVYVASDTFSLLRGKHTLKFGGEFRDFRNNNFGNDVGRMTFTNLANFLTGNVNTFSLNAKGTFSSVRVAGGGMFIQDHYKWASNLGLELGLRWDINGTPSEVYNRFVVFNPATDSLVRVGTNGINQVYKTDYKDFSPRFGVIWDPFKDGKTSVRAAYGLYFDQPVTNTVTGLASNPPFGVPLTVVATASNPVSISDPIANATGTPSANPSNVDPNFSNDYVQEWNVNIQREVARDIVVQAGYYGSKGTHLRMSYNQNQFEIANGKQVLVGGKPVRPFAGFGNISTVSSPGNSEYNALWVSVNKHLTHNLQLLGSYSWSHSIDLNSLNSQGITAQDSTNLFNERGNSDFDARHHFNVSYIYTLPFTANRLVSGWELAGITTFQSGNPVDVVLPSAAATGIGFTLRPNQTGDFHLTNPDPALWFNKTAFCAPGAPGCGASVFGSFGRNVIVGPGFNDFDFSVIKDTKLTERLTWEFRSEFFNIFNHPNFGQPGRFLGTSTFGAITGTRSAIGDAGSARQIQFAMKLIF